MTPIAKPEEKINAFLHKREYEQVLKFTSHQLKIKNKDDDFHNLRASSFSKIGEY